MSHIGDGLTLTQHAIIFGILTLIDFTWKTLGVRIALEIISFIILVAIGVHYISDDIMIAFLIALSVFILIVFIIYCPPRALLRIVSNWYDNQVLFFYDVKQPVIALSIDDSPTENTPKILEILKANDVQCTFFVIGSQFMWNQKLRQIEEGGHEIGNHGMYDEQASKLHDETLTRRITHTEHLILMSCNNAFEAKVRRWYRPGCGFFHQRMINLVSALKYYIVLGSCYPHDCIFRYATINYWYIMAKIQRGDIIIIHDREWTIPLLERLLPALKKRGFEITTIGDLQECAIYDHSN